MRLLIPSTVVVLAVVLATPVRAQSPNTASIAVVVLDESGAVVPDAKVVVLNTATGATRDATSGKDGSALVPALEISGVYKVSVTKPGFTAEDVTVTLRAGETATLKVKLVASGGKNEVTVYGTTEGVRNDPQLGMRLDSQKIDETPVLGRKVSSLPLTNAAFRPAKGTGDLFVNATYFVTGAGGRRQPAVTMDGATNDDPWGRQTMLATVPVGAVQEMTVLSNAFSAEFGWTASAAVNIVTKSGTNATHGEGLFLGRPGGLQATTLPSSAWCPPSVPTCVPPTNPDGSIKPLQPADIPDSLGQVSAAIGGPIKQDQTFYFMAFDFTDQNRTAPITTPLVPSGTTQTGNYQQGLFDGRVDHRLTSTQNLSLRFNLDRFTDTNPQDVVSGNTLPSAGRSFTRHGYSVQANHTAVVGTNKFNELRLAFLNGDPITEFEPLQPSTQITRAGTQPFTIGESRYAHIFSRQTQLSDTLTWTKGRHYLRLGGSVAYAVSGGDGTEFGSPFVLGQFTALSSTTKPPDQLTLADMQSYTQGFNFGVGSYTERQWLFAGYLQDSYRPRSDVTLDLGIRYDKQTFSDGDKNFGPRVGFAWNPKGDPRTVVRGGYGLYFTQLRSNLEASFALNGPLGIGSYTASPGQTGFPTCLPPIVNGQVQPSPCTPVVFNPNAAASTLPPRNITIRPGMAGYYTQLFAQFGVDFSKLPNYPDSLVNPKSQVTSVGVEREVTRGVYVSADYVHQHWSDLDETVDLNAPTAFPRTAPGQVRSPAAADATRPITPVNGGFRQINVIMNLGLADYDGLQTNVTYRGSDKLFAQVSYTLSKATNTTEPDGNGVNPNDANLSTLLEPERGPSLLDQRHRAVFTLTYRFPYEITAGTVTYVASARPFNATTGVDNNGDRANNDRPVINGVVVSKSAFSGTALSDVQVFVEGRLKAKAGHSLLLRAEVFNLFNHANILGRITTYGDTGTAAPNFGQAGAGLANIDPPRMVQFQVRYIF